MSITLVLLTALSACEDVNNESKPPINIEDNVTQLEDEYDAHIGVYAINTETNQTIEYHPDERFAYASTFKTLAAAMLLKQNSLKDLKKTITYTKDDLVTHSPLTEKHVDSGMTLLEISEAAIRKSDNTAGNLLLEALGGPSDFK